MQIILSYRSDIGFGALNSEGLAQELAAKNKDVILFFVDCLTEAPRNHFNRDGDMVVETKTIFRPVGWQVNGGPNDGRLVGQDMIADGKSVLGEPHGGISPVYIEVGD